ncbi:MAG: DNA polymerase IV [Candidatus Omnitrophica bacterium]|nr:DNA polymerase IV [Candidatus Omnitrophota bacterium]
MKKEPKILHIDMDAFFASVEQAYNPRLKGKPLIVGGRADKQRTVVCAASYEAKALGIDSGMSTQQALRICPDAEFVSADSAKYLYVSNQIAGMLKNYSPRIEQASVDEFYLDITGLDKMFGSYLDLGMRIKQEIVRRFSITGSVGISVNRLMSKIASKLKKPDGMMIMPREDITFVLKDLPIQKIPGIGGSLTAKLHDLSIFSFSDMRKFPADFYEQRFGKIGLWMYALAHPELIADDEKINWINQKPKDPKSISHSYTLVQNIYTRSEIEAWIQLLAEMVGFRLRGHNLQANTVHIYLRKPDMKFIAGEKNFKEYNNDSKQIFKRAIFLLDKLNTRNVEVRALGISVKNFMPATNNFLLADAQKRYQICNALDKINQRFGDWTVYPASICSII